MSFLAHRSIRKFKSSPIPAPMLEAVLSLGAQSSNTGNMQTYSVIVTAVQEEKERMAPLHFNQPMASEAPVLLTYCADFHRFERWSEIQKGHRGYLNLMGLISAIIDTTIYAEHTVCAAEQMGLGICYLGTVLYNLEKFIELLELPKGVIPLFTIAMGFPEDTANPTVRIQNSAVLHKGKYQHISDAQLLQAYQPIEDDSMSRRLCEEGGYSSFAQVITQSRFTPESYQRLSKEIMRVLQKQGFSFDSEG